LKKITIFTKKVGFGDWTAEQTLFILRKKERNHRFLRRANFVFYRNGERW